MLKNNNLMLLPQYAGAIKSLAVFHDL